MENILQQLDGLDLLHHPFFIHCLCDTGVMCYQGLHIAMARCNIDLDIQGVVWDSCPGPYPEVTFVRWTKSLEIDKAIHWPDCFRYTVFTIVFLLCSLRDWTNGDTRIKDFLQSAYFIIAHRIIPSIKKKMEGSPITFSLIKGSN